MNSEWCKAISTRKKQIRLESDAKLHAQWQLDRTSLSISRLNLSFTGSGRCFGELSILREGHERNASIITDEPTVLICLKRDTYLRFVPQTYAKDLLRKAGFVQANPLFKNWPAAYKNLLTESLQIRNVSYGETIVEQGEDVNAIYFVAVGQAQISTNPSLHRIQYPAEFRSPKSIYGQQVYEERHKSDDIDDEVDALQVKFPVLQRRRQMQCDGFFAAELRQRPELDLCVIVCTNGIIGDVESVFDLPTFSATYRCLSELTLYELDISTFIRLTAKKNVDTFETIRKVAIAKLKFRDDSIKGGIPLYKILLRSISKEKNNKIFLPKLLLLQAKKDKEKELLRRRKQMTFNPSTDSDAEKARTISRVKKVGNLDVLGCHY